MKAKRKPVVAWAVVSTAGQTFGPFVHQESAIAQIDYLDRTYPNASRGFRTIKLVEHDPKKEALLREVLSWADPGSRTSNTATLCAAVERYLKGRR